MALPAAPLPIGHDAVAVYHVELRRAGHWELLARSGSRRMALALAGAAIRRYGAAAVRLNEVYPRPHEHDDEPASGAHTTGADARHSPTR